MSKYYHGKYTPINPEKYVGDPNNIQYRSLWERKVMVSLDKSTKIERWSSEEIQVPYYDPTTQQMRRYFPDFVVTEKTASGPKTYMVEVKPQAQTQPPKVPKRQTKSYKQAILTYIKNKAKWEAATKFCEEKTWSFRLLTETQIFKKKQ